jgi:DNA-binding LacI/PurR family transcriptional regulator
MVTRERPTLEAVARRAGVSRATVSRVVNGSTTVAVAIREAVHQAVKELGYVPNQAARSLVTQRTESIALILPETANRVFSDDLFFPAVIRGVSMELDAADKQLVLMMAGSAASHDRVERYAMAGTSTASCSPPCTAPTRCPARWPGSASRWSAAAAR